MSEDAKKYGGLFVLVLVMTFITGLIVFYIGTALPSGTV